MATLKEYKYVTAEGYETILSLSDEDAKRRRAIGHKLEEVGAEPAKPAGRKGRTAANKAAPAPDNKAAKADENKEE